MVLSLTARIRRDGRIFEVPSRTRHGLVHRVAWALDDTLLCDCEAATRGKLECWAVQAVREEISMSQETAIVPVQVRPAMRLMPSEAEMLLIDRTAAMVFNGKVSLPEELKTAQQVAAVMLFGLELGLKPMTAIRHLYIVKGKVQPSCEVMAGVLMANEPDAKLVIVSIDDNHCTMRLHRPSRDIKAEYTVTWKDIERAGLQSNPMNKAYPQDRMRYHATKRLLRTYCPEIINGIESAVLPAFAASAASAVDDDALYNDGDDEATTPYIDGQVIDRETSEIQPASEASPPPAPAKATDAQRAEIANLKDAIEAQTDGKARIKDCWAWGGVTFPYAVSDGRFVSLDLREDDAPWFILRLRYVRDGAKEHEHEPAFTADGVYSCSVCAEALQDDAAPAAAQASMLT